MGQLRNVRKILMQDYDSEYKGLISKLSEILNSFMSEATDALNGNIDYSNLRQQLKTFKVKVDGSGNLITGDQIKLEINANPIGVVCLNARNLDNSAVYPTGTPFISWSVNGYILKLNNISNLQADTNYQLTIVIHYQ